MLPECEVGSWSNVEEVHQRMRSVVSPGPLEDEAPEVLRRWPIEEVLGWRNMDPKSWKGYFLVVRMEMDEEQLMNQYGGFGERSYPAELPIGLEGLAVRQKERKEWYLTGGLTGAKVTVSVQELEGEDRWLMWVHPR